MSEQPTTALSRIENKIDPSIAANTGLTNTGAMAFSSVEQIMNFAKVMAIAGIAIPKHLRENPGACLAVAIQASEWQMSPFAVASKTYVVNDRLAFEAQLINAVILRRAPIKGRFGIAYSGEGQNRRCKVTATLAEGGTVDYESPLFSTIPVKNSPLWKGDPDQQLFYYSSRAMCRRHFPDVILGVYTPEELEASTDIESEVIPVKQGRIGQPDPLTDAVKKPAPEKPKAEPKRAEKTKTEPEPTPEPEQPEPVAEPEKSEAKKPEPYTGPTADELRASILSAAKKGNIGKPMVVSYFGGEETWSGLDVYTLAGALDAWEETKAAILNQ